MSSFSCDKSIRVTSWPKANREEHEAKGTYRNEGFRFNGGFNEEKESASVLLTDCESLSSSSLSGGTTGRGKGAEAEQRRSGGRGPFLKFIPWESVTTAQANERKKERTNERADWRPSPPPFHSLSDVISRDKPQGAGSVRSLPGRTERRT